MSTALTLAQSTQDAVASDILAGRLAPDSWLRLGALSGTYGVGLSPLREAMANLVGRGLVVQEGQRGFRVAAVSLPDLRDLCETRTVLETQALRRAMVAGTANWEADILAARHRLSRHLRTVDRLIDEDWEALHRAFHFAFLAACPSPRLLALCHQLYDQFDRYRRLAVLAAGRHPAIAPIDAALLEAVLAQDMDTALALTAGHIADSTEQIRRLGTPRWFAADGEPGTGIAGMAVAVRGPTAWDEAE
jgi:GntR family carbon starvation induced transcriptional regulator